MSNRPLPALSRRAVLLGCAAAAVSSADGAVRADDAQTAITAGPVFSPSGPDAARYGAPDSLRLARGPVQFTLDKGAHRILVGSNDRVAEAKLITNGHSA